MLLYLLTTPLVLSSFSQDPITPELAEVLRMAPQEHHRAYILMEERMQPEELPTLAASASRRDRQASVSANLRAFAASSQAELRTLATNLELEGHLSFREPLWIVNGYRVAGDRIGLQQLATLPGISMIQYDPIRDPSEVQDIPLRAAIQNQAAPEKPGNGRSTTYYSEGFESGSLSSEWTTTTTACGRVQVTTAHGPSTGNYHFVCDSDSDGCYSTATLTLTLDLSAVATASLRFRFKDMNDEFHSGSDILQASDNGGLTWVKIDDLTGQNDAYITKTYDLDPLGLSYGSNFKIRWSWYDNYSATTDGFGFDDIELADYFPPPPPPAPEPNLVKHQAPDLWAEGINGAGAVLLNIDSGTDRNHPDLANRIWTNPLDPVDGVDNDGNGYVDDSWGWNFSSNNNNPNGGGHGTSTAGIMVGDGSGGVRQTGMAPGAELAVCELGNESDHWAALQWGVSVGVDCSSSSYSYKWPFSPKPDYHTHRSVSEMVLAAGQIHCNSIGNQGGSSSYPIPFNISAPGNVPGPWIHPDQEIGGIAAVLGCCGISVGNDAYYTPSGRGPSAWEDIRLYNASYPHSQNSAYWDYPVGGWGLPLPGLLKPDIAGYTDGCYTTTDGGGHGTFGGTSCATPHIGGATALMISANPNILPRHISKALQTTAIDRGPSGKDLEWGSGVAQVHNAALRLIHMAIPNTLTPNRGQTVSVALSGPAGSDYGLFYGMALGTTILPGAIGSLELDQGTLLSLGSLNTAGEATEQGTIPNNPVLAGKSIHLQSVCDDTSGTTGSYLFSLVETMVVQ